MRSKGLCSKNGPEFQQVRPPLARQSPTYVVGFNGSLGIHGDSQGHIACVDTAIL